MIGALMGAGLGLSLGGQMLQGAGEAQGARAAAGQASRQADAEHRARMLEMDRQERAIQALRGQMAVDGTSPQVQTQIGALKGLDTYGKGLGLGPQRVGRVRAGLVNRGVARAGADAKAQEEARMASMLGLTADDIAQIRSAQELRRLSYPGAMELAKAEHGGYLRQGGALMQAFGGPMAMLGLFGSSAHPGANAMGAVPRKS